jgi:hypothetical protein
LAVSWVTCAGKVEPTVRARRTNDNIPDFFIFPFAIEL